MNGPKPNRILDSSGTQAEQLEALVQRRLLGRIRLPGVHVLVQEQSLVLEECAPTYYAKQLARHAAMEVSGLPILANEIEVRYVALRRMKPQ